MPEINLSETLTNLLSKAESELTHYRLALAAAAGQAEDNSSQNLYRLLIQVARMESQVETYDRAIQYASSAEERGSDPATRVSGWLLSMLSEGARDDWSGRANDLARVKFDGVREAARRIAEEVRP